MTDPGVVEACGVLIRPSHMPPAACVRERDHEGPCKFTWLSNERAQKLIEAYIGSLCESREEIERLRDELRKLNGREGK